MRFLRNLLGLELYISVREEYRKCKKKISLKNDGFDYNVLKKQNLGTPDTSLPFGVNVIGYINSESGVGEISRGIIKSLKKAQVSISIMNLDAGWHRTKDNTVNEFSEEMPYSINLFCFNAEETPRILKGLGADKLKGRYNIGLWAWELDKFPKEWEESFDYVHEVWTISDFSKESIAKSTDLKVTKIPLLVEPELDPKYDRAYFNLPEDRFIFFFSFDGLSFADRKNPFATASAYVKAFGKDEDAKTKTMLVIKTHNLDRNHLRKLKKILEGTNNKIINTYLSREEVDGLINSIDCYVSLHRAEGFGYGLAEAMYFKKIAIATNYSGNLDFMSEENSFLVPYELSEIKRDIGPYKKGNHWAEADIGCASEIIEMVYRDRNEDYIQNKKNYAHKQIISLYSADYVGGLIKNICLHKGVG